VIGTKPALLAVTVFAMSCAECDGGLETAGAKLGRPASQAAVVGAAHRKRGVVGGGVSLRQSKVRSIRKSPVRQQLAVKKGQKVRLIARAAHRKNVNRAPSKVRVATRKNAILGLASFYSGDQETASGERFDSHAMNAAHPSFPFGTRLRVTNVRNGKSVTVRVNDRGPFVGGRIIDVTSAAAEALGMVDAGVANVTLDIVR
jgi:rare lipoprotein A